MQLDDHYVLPAIVILAIPTMASTDEASWGLLDDCLTGWLPTLQVASACRGDAVISTFYLRAKEEKQKSLKHRAEFASTTVASLVDTGNVSDAHCWLTLWLWLVQEEKIKTADHKHSALAFARCELSDAAHAPGSSARASSDSWSKVSSSQDRC